MIKGVKGQNVYTALEVDGKFEYTTKDLLKLFKWTKEIREEIKELKKEIELLKADTVIKPSINRWDKILIKLGWKK